MKNAFLLAIVSITRETAANNNRFSSLVLGIVKSRTFQFNSRYEDDRQEGNAGTEGPSLDGPSFPESIARTPT